MPLVTVRDANGNLVQIEAPLAPGRALATVSRPVVLSMEDWELLRPPILGASTDLAFSSISAQSAALVGTRVRLLARGANCRVAIAVDPTATATDTLLMQGVESRFTIVSGSKVAAIRDESTDGTLNITVLS